MSHLKHKKLSRIAMACSLALVSHTAISASNDISGSLYNTFNTDTTVSGNIAYSGYAGYTGSDDLTTYGNIYPVIKNATVDGVISTYYLNDSAANNNALSITDSTIHGMITSDLLTNTAAHDGTAMTPLSLTIDNSTIDDTYERYTSTVDGVNNTVNTFGLGNAITLDQESNIAIQNNSRVAGITLTQGYEWENPAETFNDNVTIKDSVLTSGSYSELETSGFYGQSEKPSDYTGAGGLDDAALIVASNGAANNAMITNVDLDHSTMTGDVLFSSEFHDNFYPNGTASNTDGVINTNGYANADQLNLSLNNGSKWTGAAVSDVDATSTLYDVAPNSIWPSSTTGENGIVNGNSVYQSGVFNIALDNGSGWDTRNASNIDALTVNNNSAVTLADSSLLADSIALTNNSAMNIQDSGRVYTDALNIDSNSLVTLTQENSALYANQITVTNYGMLDLGLGQTDTHNLVLSDNGILNVGSRDYVLNSDLNNGRYITNDAKLAGYDQGRIAINSDGHLAVNGDTNGNYKVVITDSTGTGSVADYKGKELIRVYDKDTAAQANFTAGNRADLGAYTYQAKQVGDTVVLEQKHLTAAANMAASLPSANANVWHLEQDVLNGRQTATRHTQGDKGGVWANYLGSNIKGDNGTIDYNQDINGIMIGVDKIVEGGSADWLLGAAAGFEKGRIDHNSGSVSQDSQSARIYASTMFKNNVFIDSSLSYSRYSNDLQADMSNGQQASANTNSSAWGFGAKLGYDWAINTQAYATPYASISGVFVDGNDYSLNNGMKVSDNAYDSIRYEAGINGGYTFSYGDDQSLTPYATLAYVYDDGKSNNVKINGDSVDNGVGGSAVRVAAGTQFNFSKNFSTNAGIGYLGGSDVDQPWTANVGVKYNW